MMAWRRPGDKPLSEPMMVSLLTHICVTQPQWVNITIVEIRICMSNNIPWFNREWLLIHALILMPIQRISINKKGPLMIWSKMVDMISWFKMVDMISQILTVIERKSLILHGQYPHCLSRPTLSGHWLVGYGTFRMLSVPWSYISSLYQPIVM